MGRMTEETKIYPLTGITVTDQIDICVNAVCLNGKKYFDFVTIISRSELKRLSLDKSDIFCDDFKSVLYKFPEIKTFAMVNKHMDMAYALYFLRIAISILYIAQFLHCKNNTYYTINIGICSSPITSNNENDTFYEYVVPNIGDVEISRNNYDMTIPCVYSRYSDTPIWKQTHQGVMFSLDVSNDVIKTVNDITKLLLYNNKLSRKIQSSLNLFYYVLPQTNIDLSIIYLSTILETLLLENSNKNIKKKVSVRAACLIHNNEEIRHLSFVANWIHSFYEDRCSIIHDGIICMQKNSEDRFSINRGLSIAKFSVAYILESFIKYDVKSIKDIESIVENNKKRLNLSTAFDLINNNMIAYDEY